MMFVFKLIPAVLVVVAASSIQGAPYGPPPSDDAGPPPEVMAMFAEAMAKGMSGEEAAAYVQQKMMEAMGVDPSMLGPPPSKRKQKKSDDEAPPPEVMAMFAEAMAKGMSGEEAAAYVQQKMMEAMGVDPSMLGPPPSKQKKSDDEAPPPEVMAMFAEAMAKGMSGEEAAAYVQQKMMEAMGVDPSMLGPPPSKRKQKKSDDEAPPPEVMAMFAEAMAKGMSGEEAAAYVQQKMMEAMGVDPSMLGPPPSKRKQKKSDDEAPPPEVMAMFAEAMAKGMSGEEAAAYVQQKMMEAMGVDPSMLGPPPSKREQKKSDDEAPPPEVMAMFAEAMAKGMSGEEAAAYVQQKMMEAMGVDPSMLGPPPSKQKKSH
ncbi:uncharacterized protein LOC144911201 [Branchiostoma floridae x Branchiostoma belcheri]